MSDLILLNSLFPDLETLLKTKKVPQVQVYTIAGVTKEQMSKVANKRDPSKTSILKVQEALNAIKLHLGKEIKDIEAQDIKKIEELSKDFKKQKAANVASKKYATYSKGLPFYDIEVHATPDAEILEQLDSYRPSFWLSVPQFKDAEFCLRVQGESMIPRFYPGDYVAVKRVNDNGYIEYGKVYVIFTYNNNLRILKALHRHPKDLAYYTLKSINPEFEDQHIEKKDIRSLYLVLGCVGFL